MSQARENRVGHFSRERAAGYDPHILQQATLMVVGGGAVGQNVIQNCALSQVGSMAIVDFDTFESHNATRSPLFPTEEEWKTWSGSKAAIVAHKSRRLVGWSKYPRVYYFHGAIQALGDLPFRKASIVISAVDNFAARAYISRMSRKLCRPLVEGGFDGASISYAAFGNGADDPCWQCLAGNEKEDVLRRSCDEESRRQEAAGFIPATQPAAAALGALMSEATIRILHGDTSLLNRRIYCDVRTGRSRSVKLTRNPACPARHDPYPRRKRRVETSEDRSAGELLQELSHQFCGPEVFLPAPFVMSVSCPGKNCSVRLDVNRPKWALLSHPRCRACGGSFPLSGDRRTSGYVVFDTLSHATPELSGIACRDLGLVGGALVEMIDDRDKSLFIEIPQTCGPFSVVDLEFEREKET